MISCERTYTLELNKDEARIVEEALRLYSLEKSKLGEEFFKEYQKTKEDFNDRLSRDHYKNMAEANQLLEQFRRA